MNTARWVGDIMTREVAVLHEEDNVEHILRQMYRLSLRHVPVVDGARIVGLVTHQDMLRFTVSELLVDVDSPRTRAAYLEDLKQNTFVSKIMTQHLLTVTPQTPILEAADVLLHATIGCLPVVENDRLVGIVTETDFLGLLVRMLRARTTSAVL